MSSLLSEEEEESTRWHPIFLNTSAMIGLVVITWLISLRVKQLWLKPKFARQTVEYMTLVLLTASGTFVLAVIPLATTNFLRGTQCLAALIVCLLFYGVAKFAVIFLLMEKAYIVNRGITDVPRRRHPLYKFNMGLLLFYAVLFSRLIIESDYEMSTSCRLSYGETSVAVLLCWDILAGFYFTALFLVPLARSMNVVEATGATLHQLESIRKTMKTCLWGAIFMGLSSSINLVPVAIEGWQRVEMCLFMCCMDVVINSVVAHYMTPLARVREVSKTVTYPTFRNGQTSTTWATKPKSFKESRVRQASSTRENVTPSEILDEDSNLLGLSGV